MARRILPPALICLAGFILLGAPIMAPPVDAGTAETGLCCALVGLGFIALGALDLIRYALRER